MGKAMDKKLEPLTKSMQQLEGRQKETEEGLQTLGLKVAQLEARRNDPDDNVSVIAGSTTSSRLGGWRPSGIRVRWCDYPQLQETQHPRGLEPDEVKAFMEQLRAHLPERLQTVVYPCPIPSDRRLALVDISVHPDYVQEVVAHVRTYTASAQCELRGVRTKEEDPPHVKASSAMMGKFIGFFDNHLLALLQHGADQVSKNVDWQQSTIYVEGLRRDNGRDFYIQVGKVQGTAIAWHEEFTTLMQLTRLQLNQKYKAATSTRRAH